MRFRAEVARLEPLQVNIPGVTGTDRAADCELDGEVASGLAIGDAVWVEQVFGSYGWVLVGRRPTVTP